MGDYVYSADELREQWEQEDKSQDDLKVDEAVNRIFSALVGVIVVGRILAENDPDKGKPVTHTDKGKPVVNMCSKAMKKAELKEMKRQARLIKRRYG